LYKEAKLNEFLDKNYNIIDLLKQYDSLKIDFLEFYTMMPKILVNIFLLIRNNLFLFNINLTLINIL